MFYLMTRKNSYFLNVSILFYFLILKIILVKLHMFDIKVLVVIEDVIIMFESWPPLIMSIL